MEITMLGFNHNLLVVIDMFTS